MSVKDFLLARIAEDEAAAGGGGYSSWHTVECGVSLGYWANDKCECNGPARVLAECAAKRAIAEGWEDPMTMPGWYGERVEGRVEELDDVMRRLAAVYSDHPDYDASWVLPT